MKKLFLGLIVVGSIAAKANTTNCIRLDSNKVEGLKGAKKAEISKRKYNFDSRIRFFNQNNDQVDTCSTDLGEDNLFNCWQSAGIQGESDEAVYALTADSLKSESSLAKFKTPFTFSIRRIGGTEQTTFMCN